MEGMADPAGFKWPLQQLQAQLQQVLEAPQGPPLALPSGSDYLYNDILYL